MGRLVFLSGDCESANLDGTPQTRWCDDLRGKSGKSWLRVAENRVEYRAKGEVYLQQCTALG